MGACPFFDVFGPAALRLAVQRRQIATDGSDRLAGKFGGNGRGCDFLPRRCLHPPVFGSAQGFDSSAIGTHQPGDLAGRKPVIFIGNARRPALLGGKLRSVRARAGQHSGLPALAQVFTIRRRFRLVDVQENPHLVIGVYRGRPIAAHPCEPHFSDRRKNLPNHRCGVKEFFPILICSSRRLDFNNSRKPGGCLVQAGEKARQEH